MSALSIQLRAGDLHLPGVGLWLDPHRPQNGPDRVFVSHAHSDHTGRHREVILTEATSRLMQLRIGGERTEHLLRFNEVRPFQSLGRDWRITLLSAGHILGSAMALVEVEGESLLYTGDFKLSRGFSSAPFDLGPVSRVDALIMETTFGRPEYRFPPVERVREEIVQFCREAMDRGETPILLAYSLGKTQELMRLLAGSGLAIVLQEAAYDLAQVYEEFGQVFPSYEKYDGHNTPGRVVICPPMSRLLETLKATTRVRTAVVTGWAMDSSCRFRAGTDAAFPLSDHADFPDLLEFVRRVSPRRVYTIHGFATDFALALRERGIDARALGRQEQLTFSF